MESSPNPILSLLSLWMFLQLATTLGLLLGGIYALFCLSKTAASTERLAEAVERLALRDTNPINSFASGTPAAGDYARPVVPPSVPPSPGTMPMGLANIPPSMQPPPAPPYPPSGSSGEAR